MKVNCIYVEVFTLDSGFKSAVTEKKKYEKALAHSVYMYGWRS